MWVNHVSPFCRRNGLITVYSSFHLSQYCQTFCKQ
jgi:hypothetical protein